jgi:hypothetical protein
MIMGIMVGLIDATGQILVVPPPFRRAIDLATTFIEVAVSTAHGGNGFVEVAGILDGRLRLTAA